MQNLENVFQRIDNEFRDLKQAENTNVEGIIKLMALDDAKIWKFRKHKEVYEEIARKGVEEAVDTL